jgi:DNA-3-methyladenine glycosylase II
MNTILYFDRNSPEVKQLAASDARLGELMVNRIETLSHRLRTDHTASIVRAIIGQQLSVKAAATIWQRTETLCGAITPEKLLTMADEDLRGAGLSGSKVIYIKDFCQRICSGELDLAALSGQDDETVIAALTTVKGIGRWTAEMFLIFSLGRPDVLAVADLGLQRSAKWLYGLADMPTKADMARLGENWRPYRSVASLYLWEAINRGLVDIGSRPELQVRSE